MLEFIRKHSNSIVVKVFLTILAGSFFLFFGFSYIVDRIKGRDYVVKIDNIKISPQLFKIERMKKIEMFQKLFPNKNVDSDISKTVLHQLIFENLIDLASRDFGIIVSDSTMYSLISNLEMFRTSDGHFSAANLRNFLQRIQIPEAVFLESRKREIKTHILKTPFKFISMIDELDIYANAEFEQRSLNIIEINPRNIKITEKPLDEDLETFYANHPEEFMVPEMRSFRILSFSESDIEKSIKVSEEELKESYDFSDQKDERSFEEMKSELLSELKQEKLNKEVEDFTRQIEDTIVSGENVEEIANKYKLKIKKINNVKFNDRNKINLPYENDVLTVAFSTEEKEASSFSESMDDKKNIVQWLVYVDSITPKHIENFDKVKSKVKEKWKVAKQDEKAVEEANQIIKDYKNHKKINRNIIKTSVINRNGELDTHKIKKSIAEMINIIRDEIFSIKKEDITYKKYDGIVYVYYLDKIVHDRELIDKNKHQYYLELLEQNTEDMYQQLFGYFAKKYKVKVNNELLKEIDDSVDLSKTGSEIL